MKDPQAEMLFLLRVRGLTQAHDFPVKVKMPDGYGAGKIRTAIFGLTKTGGLMRSGAL